MNEAELRKLIGDAKVEEIKSLVQKAKKQGKSPDAIKEEVQALLKKYTDLIFNTIGSIQMFVPPNR